MTKLLPAPFYLVGYHHLDQAGANEELAGKLPE